MLERNDQIYTIHESDVSIEKVYNYFFKIESRIIYVVDIEERFVGVITSQKFLDSIETLNVPINRQCLTIALKEEQAMLEDAIELFKKYCITTAIPVVDEDGKLCCEIRKVRNNHQAKVLTDFYEKIRMYEKGSYLCQEIVGLKKCLQEQAMIIIGTEQQFQNIFSELLPKYEHIIFMEELENAYEFMFQNGHLLIDVSTTEYSMRKDLYSFSCNGYSWDDFLDLVIRMIEKECFSRFCRITDNQIATLKDYLEKYSDGRVYISSWGVLTSALKKYLNNSSLKLIVQKGLLRKSSFRYCYTGNGVTIKELTGGEQLLMEQADVMLQYFYLYKELSEQVSVLNFAFDVRVEIPGQEKQKVVRDRLFFLKDYVEGIEDKNLEVPFYTRKTKEPKHLMKLQSSLKFCMKRRFEKDLIIWKDVASDLVNIENGIRKTCYQPTKYVGTIYLFGMCTIYGALVEDRWTIPSIIQQYINKSGKAYRVVNLGSEFPGNHIRIKETLNISENDIIVILFPFITDGIKKRIPILEVGEGFNRIWKNEFYGKECFMDAVQHCGDNGNIIYSQIIYQELEKHLAAADEKSLRQNSVYNVFKPNTTDLDALYSFNSYIAELRKEKERIPESTEKIGCIVMNCNPFTSGHRYLIEYALDIVDYLYIFVVEENRSFFPFQHRYEMVKRGTCDLENVSVVRSGKLIISSETFPTYFTKDTWHSQDDICLNEDLRIFAQYIAPVLDIQYRFVGEEPTDYVTNQYNIAMKRILPDIAGIQVVEIPRMEIGGKVVSATTVRECYKKKDFSEMRALVPQTTLEYLEEMAGH